jgi:flagellar motor switch protein FliN/FliY
MSTLFNERVDISPPDIDVLGFPPKKLEDLHDDIILEISFRLKIGNLIDSNMIQFIPLTFGKEMIQKILYTGDDTPANTVAEKTIVAPTEQIAIQNTMIDSRVDHKALSQNTTQAPKSATQASENANVQKVEYSTFSHASIPSTGSSSIDMLYDIPLNITVELGRTEMPIRKILELGPGAVIQLDKLAGEPVDILANHKLIAKGEVVVIEENFGVRITEIISPIERISKMTM